jgi:hypothetical protein
MAKNNNIEIVKNSEYADMVIDHVELHGNVLRKPKEWHPELSYNSRLHKAAKIYTSTSNVNIDTVPNFGTIMAIRFSMSEKNLVAYKKAIKLGKNFKIRIPENRMVKIFFDRNLKEAIKSNNRRVGFEQFKIIESFGKVIDINIDTSGGTLIIKVVV